MRAWQGVLFDLDGTLVDSAPDLAAAANRMRESRGLAPLPDAEYRAWAGSGARGMLRVGFQLTPESPTFEAMKAEFFDAYEAGLCERTDLFEGVAALIDALDAQALPWGIVTNKMERFALPLQAALPSLRRATCIVGGDSTPHAKPHPAPLFEACRRAGVRAEQCVYVGDDLRDIQAGRAAGMTTVAASYGYLGFGQNPHDWGADFVVDSVQALLQCLELT